MEYYWIEIKRFLNDYKKNIIIGAIVFSVLFAITMIILEPQEVPYVDENEEVFSPSPEEILNEAQPAHFQVFIETEDGSSFTNSSLINQYFNLPTVKETAQEKTGVDIKKVEEEVLENNLADEISVINVNRNEKSHLLTMAFNLGNERNNIVVADYYYDLLFADELSLFEGKEIYVFVEPIIAERKEAEEVPEDIATENTPTENNIIPRIVDVVIGVVLGTVLLIGLVLLKVLYGRTLNYSFAYDVREEDQFMLYDKQLGNKENISQFITVPIRNHKIVVTEKDIDGVNKNILSGNKDVAFDKQLKPEILLTEVKSLSNINLDTEFSEIVILIHPYETTRKWYKTQKQFLDVYNLPTKIIQLNK